jgi:hypothetical protein
MQYISETGDRMNRYIEGRNSREPYARLFQKGYMIMCSAVLIKREVYEKAGGFDESFMAAGLQDMEWMSRIVECTEIGHLPETLVLYRDHGTRIPRDRARWNEGLYLDRLWERHHGDPMRRRFLAGERAAFLSNRGQNEIRAGCTEEGRKHLREALSLSLRYFVNTKMALRSMLRLGRSYMALDTHGRAGKADRANSGRSS